jgi:5-methylcytosine-specific restriction endonuclease McrA
VTIVANEEKPKSFKLPNRDSWVRVKLRRVSLQWPARTEAMRRARVDRGIYQCAMCKDQFRVKEIELDHVNPVVNIKTGKTTLDEYVERLFPDVEGFQVLCLSCHNVKTTLEDKMRVTFRKSKKRT